MRTRANDPNKVKELMDSISEIGLQVPVKTTLSNYIFTTLIKNFIVKIFFLNIVSIFVVLLLWFLEFTSD